MSIVTAACENPASASSTAMRPEEDPRLPVSARVRARIQRAMRRFPANDNISAFLAPGELEGLLDEVETKMTGVLESLVIDTGSDHNTQDTARRVTKIYRIGVFPELNPFASSWRASMPLLEELIATGAAASRVS